MPELNSGRMISRVTGPEDNPAPNLGQVNCSSPETVIPNRAKAPEGLPVPKRKGISFVFLPRRKRIALKVNLRTG